MRILLFTCSLLALVSLLVPNLQATSSVAGPGTVIRGKITKIEDGLGTFVLTSKEGKSVAVRTKDKTKFFVDSVAAKFDDLEVCLLYTSPSPRDKRQSRMPSSA